MPRAEEIIDLYIAAWNENDPDKRQLLLEQCCAGDVQILSGNKQISGRDEVAREIDAFRRGNSHDIAKRTSGIDRAGQWYRFSACVARPDEATYSHLVDVVQVGADGKILRVLTFPNIK